MANAARDLYPERGNNNPEVINLAGRIGLSSSPTRVAGRAYTVTRAPTGRFSIVTDFQWKEMVGGAASVLSATLTDAVQIVSYSPSTRTIVLQFQSAGAADDGTTAKFIWFCFQLTQKGLSVT